MGKKGLSRIALHAVMEKKQLFKEAETVFFVLFRYPHFPFHSEWKTKRKKIPKR